MTIDQPVFLGRDDVLGPLAEIALPWIVLSDNMRSRIGLRIKTIGHAPGYYSHAMTCARAGRFASQDAPLYREVAAESYLDGGWHRLKVWWFPGLSPARRVELCEVVRKSLEESLWRRLYDFLGVFGHWIGREELNAPRLRYCTERVVDLIDAALPRNDAPRHPTPAKLNAWLLRRSLERGDVAVFGVYSPEFCG